MGKISVGSFLPYPCVPFVPWFSLFWAIRGIEDEEAIAITRGGRTGKM